ncbi:pseudouridine synthase [Devosia aurantiaca]|uniref:pseudouridine synthase n=1 Tax=Devosia aurantiaca TaxID=2714858 RepID=UPI001A987710|nr:pseudouridine synthase [Devosia aurantiaca]
MSRLILFNKPYGVLTQFTGEPGDRTLAEFIKVPGVYAAGRLDKDSEGLLVMTDDGRLQAQISSPKFNKEKTYLVQVEGIPDPAQLAQLRKGVELKDGMTRPAKATVIEPPALWDRDPRCASARACPTAGSG